MTETLPYCRCCASVEALVPLWPGLPLKDYLPFWGRCLSCGSDSSTTTWTQAQKLYDSSYIQHNLVALGFEALCNEVRSNTELFVQHHPTSRPKTFLDVGCLEGAALHVMKEHGFLVHGFDIIPELKNSVSFPLTIAPFFMAELFSDTYQVVLCREVLEHVPGWRQLLNELFKVTAVGGLCQVQTPRPSRSYHPSTYTSTHLQVISPTLLHFELIRLGFTVLKHLQWPQGQLVFCQKT